MIKLSKPVSKNNALVSVCERERGGEREDLGELEKGVLAAFGVAEVENEELRRLHFPIDVG